MSSGNHVTRVARLLEIRPARHRDQLYAAGIVLAMACTALVLLHYHPSTLRVLPPCPVKAVLGIECPGCGSTRAVHHLLNLRLSEAWRHNPAMIVVGLPLLGMLLADLGSTLLMRKRIIFAPRSPFGIAAAVLLIAYMVARNLL